MTAMKVVPIEPTDEMLRASALASLGIFLNRGDPADHREPCQLELDAAKAAHKAMLSAVEPAPDGLVEPAGVLARLISYANANRCELTPEDAYYCAAMVQSAALTSRAAVLEEAAKNDWIAVSEKLPEAKVDVLFVNVFDGKPLVCLGWKTDADKDSRQWIDRTESDRDGTYVDVYDVTHWQPLPALPAIRAAKGE